MANSKLKRYTHATIGLLFVIVAAVGAVLPGIPTVGPLMLASSLPLEKFTSARKATGAQPFFRKISCLYRRDHPHDQPDAHLIHFNDVVEHLDQCDCFNGHWQYQVLADRHFNNRWFDRYRFHLEIPTKSTGNTIPLRLIFQTPRRREITRIARPAGSREPNLCCVTLGSL